MLWKLGVQGDQAEGVVEVSECVDEGWVAVLDNGRQAVLRGLPEVLLSLFDLAPSEVLLVSLQMGLDGSELV